MGVFGRSWGRCLAILVLLAAAACSQPEATVAPDAPASVATQLRAKDNGGSFTYKVAGFFQVFLDPASYPKEGFACAPDNVIQEVEGTTGVYDIETGFYGVAFEALAAGSCVLTNGDYSVTITVTE